MATTTVLSILSLTTRPTSRLRLFAILLFLAHPLRRQFTLTQNCLQPGDVSLQTLHNVGVLQRPGGFVKTLVEHILLDVFKLVEDFLVAQLANFTHVHYPTS